MSLWKEFIKSHRVVDFDIEHVDKIADVLSEELQQLSEVSSEGKSLIEGPYSSGIEWLREASKPYRTRVEAIKSLGTAKEKFIDALGSSGSHLYRRAMIEFPIAVCCYLIDDKAGAYDWFVRSKASLVDALSELDQKEKRAKLSIIPLTASIFAMAPVFLGATGVAATLDIVRGKDPNKVKGFAHNVQKGFDLLFTFPAPMKVVGQKRRILQFRLQLLERIITFELSDNPPTPMEFLMSDTSII